VILDFLHRKLPGIPPATFSVVDARDVAEAMWLGRRKEVAVNATLPRHGTWRWGICFRSWSRSPKFLRRDGLCPCRFCTRWQPRMKSGLALTNGQRRSVLRPVRLMAQERERTRFNHEKSERELGIQFRPVEETLSETIRWYRQNGWLKTPPLREPPPHAAGQRT
jgi:dihydroflavonol-4-reductase